MAILTTTTMFPLILILLNLESYLCLLECLESVFFNLLRSPSTVVSLTGQRVGVQGRRALVWGFEGAMWSPIGVRGQRLRN